MTAGVHPSAVVLVIIDGLSDVSVTSLMAVETPTLDRAASRGRVGLIDPVEPGLACGSDTAHLSIFGYEPRTCYHGRGALEALGAGLSLTPDCVAFKANFASLTPNQTLNPLVRARCASNHPQMHSLASRLSSSLNNIDLSEHPDIQVAVHHAGGHRCNVSISGPNLSDQITNTDPLRDDLPLQLSCAIDPQDKDAVRTAAIVNYMSDRIRHLLPEHPENTIPGVRTSPVTDVLLLRGASQNIIVEPFLKRHGINAFLIAPTHIVAGVGITVGMSLLPVDGATGGYDTDLLKKASACIDELMRTDEEASHQSYFYSLGVLHVKAVDEAVRPNFILFFVSDVVVTTVHTIATFLLGPHLMQTITYKIGDHC